jgi:hypothetical protein
LTGSDLLHSFTQRCETLSYLLDLRWVDGWGRGRFRRDSL